MISKIGAVLASGLAILLGSITLADAKQLAIVIGNDTYTEVPALVAGVNDARAMSSGLQRAGFGVDVVENGTKRQISRALATFEGKIEPGDTVVFHYSGHGFEIDGQNWLLPIDIPAAREGESGLVKDEAFNAADVIDRFRAKGAARVIAILDACRNNPFAKTGTRALSGGRGLARMEPSGGVFIMFSAGAKQEALDRLSPGDPEKTSVFVRSLLPLLNRTELTLIDLAKETQERVGDLARSVGHEQNPAYYDGIAGRITLTGARPNASVAIAAKSEAVAERPLPPAGNPQPATVVAALPTRDATSPEIEACDRAAASPHDKEKPASIPGVEYKALAGQTGVLACLKAAQNPDAPRRIPFQLGRAYSKIGNNRDAAQSYIKAANLKHPIAMHNLAVLNLKGEGMPRDYSTARVLFESAAAAGIHESLNEVGALYELGRGASRDYNKAKFYYEKAIAAGDPAAGSRLGAMYVNGTGVRKDMAKACELFRSSASMGNAAASTNARRFCGR